MNQVVTIRDRRQITLPRLFLNKFGLDIGDKLILRLASNQIRIEPIKTQTTDLLSKIQQLVKKTNTSEKDFQRTGVSIRKELSKQYSG